MTRPVELREGRRPLLGIGDPAPHGEGFPDVHGVRYADVCIPSDLHRIAVGTDRLSAVTGQHAERSPGPSRCRRRFEHHGVPGRIGKRVIDVEQPPQPRGPGRAGPDRLLQSRRTLVACTPNLLAQSLPWLGRAFRRALSDLPIRALERERSRFRVEDRLPDLRTDREGTASFAIEVEPRQPMVWLPVDQLTTDRRLERIGVHRVQLDQAGDRVDARIPRVDGRTRSLRRRLLDSPDRIVVLPRQLLRPVTLLRLLQLVERRRVCSDRKELDTLLSVPSLLAGEELPPGAEERSAPRRQRAGDLLGVYLTLAGLNRAESALEQCLALACILLQLFHQTDDFDWLHRARLLVGEPYPTICTRPRTGPTPSCPRAMLWDPAPPVARRFDAGRKCHRRPHVCRGESSDATLEHAGRTAHIRSNARATPAGSA